MLKVDLAVYNQSQELVLTVEVKSIRNVSDIWAAELRRNILAHGNYPLAKYFLLATPDRFFLWIEDDNGVSLRQPDHSIDVRDTLKPFFKEYNVEPESVSGFIFEQIIGRWLKGIMYPVYRDSKEEIPAWVIRSGLDKAVFQGDFSFEKAA